MKKVPIASIEERLSKIESLLLSQEEVLGFDEAAKFLNLSKSYLYKLTSSRKIPHSKPNGKVIYFARSKLENWALRNRIKTVEEIDQEVSNNIVIKNT